MSATTLHCWTEAPTDERRLCIRPLGHAGRCRFVPVADVRIVVFPEEMGAWQFEEDAIVVDETPLDQAKRAAGDTPLPGLEEAT